MSRRSLPRCAIRSFFSPLFFSLFVFSARSQGFYPGAVDPTFIPGSLYRAVQEPFFISSFPDDSLLFCEEFRLKKLNPDGLPDYSFPSIPGDFGGFVAKDPSGPLIVSRALTNWHHPAATDLLWLEPDGTISRTLNLGAVALPVSFTPQPDGKMLAISDDGALRPRGAVYRLNRDGSRDQTFVSSTFDREGSTKILPQDNGKIIIAGLFTTWLGVPRKGIVRLNSDGTLDESYAPGLYLSGPNYSWPNDAVLQQDDKLVIIGNFSTVYGELRKYVARLNTDGTLDLSFDFQPPATMKDFYRGNISLAPNAKLIFSGDDFVFQLSPSGQIEFFAQPPAFLSVVRNQGDIITAADNRDLQRIKPDGSIDRFFSRRAPSVEQLLLDSNGKIWLSGSIPDPISNPQSPYTLAVIGEDGTPRNISKQLIRRFGIQGKQFVAWSGAQIYRLNPDGTVDPSFHTWDASRSGFPTTINAIVPTPDNKILIRRLL
jgi:uncharacterized delta-60 repeat protein